MADQTLEQSIFLSAIELAAPADRAAYLDEACRNNPGLRAEVDALLAAHDRLGGAPRPIAPESPGAFTPPSDAVGMVIGPYKLLQQIGEGGMGTVYMAEQTQPMQRKVALKIIKPGMDSKQVIARFEAERQALALMDHANIARVLDGGTTGAGRPFFVMELVKGEPITKYCDEHHLTPRQRLELFVPVCQAVQHAHQKGIIHRDLKPSNVLVALYDGRPVPKVIDFGVAKATGLALTEKTLVTGFGNIVGTLEYMSPEQAEINQLDVDTRCDIYSLGVLLYELLAGSPPFSRKELEKAGMLEMLRVIREQEPSKPSTKLSTAEGLPTLAANRGTEPAKLTQLVRGELDWIVMKALEKDRNRRYETANGFAMDVQRYLADEAVLACPPSVGYRFRKFARRNRVALLTVGVVALALVLGTVVSVWQAIRATHAEVAAKQEAAISAAVNEFLNEDLLAKAGPRQTPDRDLKLRAVLDRASQRIEGRFAEQPLVEARLRTTLAMTYESLGEYLIAERHAQRARDLYERARGAKHPDTLGAMHNLARVLAWQNRLEESRQLFEEVVALRRRALGAEHPDTLASMSDLATVLRHLDRFEEARSLHHETLEARRRVLGAEHPATLSSATGLAVVLFQQERLGEARDLLEGAVPVLRRVLGVEHPDTLGSMHQLAHVLVRQGHYEDAFKLYKETLELQRRVLGNGHMNTVASMNNLSWLLATAPDKKLREPAEAVALAKEVVKADPNQSNGWNTLGVAYCRAGDWENAIAALDKSVELHKGVDSYNAFFLAEAHWQLSKAEKTTAEEQARQQREARKWYDSAVAWMEKNQPQNEELLRFRAETAALIGVK